MKIIATNSFKQEQQTFRMKAPELKTFQQIEDYALKAHNVNTKKIITGCGAIGLYASSLGVYLCKGPKEIAMGLFAGCVGLIAAAIRYEAKAVKMEGFVEKARKLLEPKTLSKFVEEQKYLRLLKQSHESLSRAKSRGFKNGKKEQTAMIELEMRKKAMKKHKYAFRDKKY